MRLIHFVNIYHYTAWRVSKYGVISGPYFPVFGLNTGKYGPEITPYLDAFHAIKEHLGWTETRRV